MSASLATHVLENRRGDRVELLNLGARIRSLTLALASGERDVVLGYAALTDYLDDRYYLGSTIGRYANRLHEARFEIDGQGFALTPNEGPNQLHGGPAGFDRRIWETDRLAPGRLSFRLVSADGDQGFPGRLSVTAEFELTDDRELVIRYRARTDRATPVNLSCHAYFNLDAQRETIDGHFLEIASDTLVATTAAKIPTGAFESVDGRVLDLRRQRRVGELTGADEPVLRRGSGPDLCYLLNGEQPAASLWSPARDLRLAVSTSYPGIQLYAGQYLDRPFAPRAGLCLEAQFLPDSPNQATFPSTILRPGEAYDEWIRYTFSEGTST